MSTGLGRVSLGVILVVTGSGRAVVSSIVTAGAVHGVGLITFLAGVLVSTLEGFASLTPLVVGIAIPRWDEGSTKGLVLILKVVIL